QESPPGRGEVAQRGGVLRLHDDHAGLSRRRRCAVRRRLRPGNARREQTECQYSKEHEEPEGTARPDAGPDIVAQIHHDVSTKSSGDAVLGPEASLAPGPVQTGRTAWAISISSR